jgi:TonB family protein
MTATKFIIPFVLVSIAGHALVLALTTHIHMTDNAPPDKVLKVELKTETEIETPPPARKERPVPIQRVVNIPDGYREETVALQNPDSRFESYLRPISRKINGLWTYPPEAITEKQEGTAVVRFTIDAKGVLKDNRIVTSSGSPILDDGALAVVRAASPFAPLPAALRLTRLNLVAEFHYRLD